MILKNTFKKYLRNKRICHGSRLKVQISKSEPHQNWQRAHNTANSTRSLRPKTSHIVKSVWLYDMQGSISLLAFLEWNGPMLQKSLSDCVIWPYYELHQSPDLSCEAEVGRTKVVLGVEYTPFPLWSVLLGISVRKVFINSLKCFPHTMWTWREYACRHLGSQNILNITSVLGSLYHFVSIHVDTMFDIHFFLY